MNTKTISYRPNNPDYAKFIVSLPSHAMPGFNEVLYYPSINKLPESMKNAGTESIKKPYADVNL